MESLGNIARGKAQTEREGEREYDDGRMHNRTKKIDRSEVEEKRENKTPTKKMKKSSETEQKFQQKKGQKNNLRLGIVESKKHIVALKER